MTPPTADYQLYVGIDIAATTFTAAWMPPGASPTPLDAHTLAQLAAALQPAVWTPPPAVYHDTAQGAPGQRLTARDALVAMRQQRRNQRQALLHWPLVVTSVRDHLDEVIAMLDGRIADLEAEIAAVLATSDWASPGALWAACLTSAPGIGVLTAAGLLVSTMNFTLCATPEVATAYAGLAPVPHLSGTSVRGGARIGHGGQGRLRTALYMATRAAVRHNPAIKAFYARLRGVGKPSKVARCAAARKRLHLAWTLVTKQQRYQSNHRIPDHAMLAA